MLLGALMIHGIIPGPLLFVNNAALVHTIFAALVITNLLMLAMQYYGIRIFVKLLSMKKYILMPIILVMCAVGAFGHNNRVFDVVCLGAFGIFGYLMARLKFPLAPLIIGYILGPMAEENLRRALMRSEFSLVPFITSPIALVFFTASIVSVVYALAKKNE